MLRTSLLVLLTLAAPAAAQTVRDSAGVRIVENDKPLWKDREAWTVADTPGIDIGRADGLPAYQFDGVGGVHLLSDGGLVTADMGSMQLRFFDENGAVVRTVGRRGQGPGEFRHNLILLSGPGDTLLVIDTFNHGQFFAPDGSLLRAFEFKPSAGVDVADFHGFLRDGTLVASSDPAFGQPPPRAPTRPLRVSMKIVRVSRAGGVLNSIAESPFLVIAPGQPAAPMVYGPLASVAAADSEVVVGFGDNYELRRYGEGGALHTVIRRKWARSPVRLLYKDAFHDALLTPRPGRSLSSQARAAMEKQYREAVFADYLPAYLDVLVDAARNVWVMDTDLPHAVNRTMFRAAPVDQPAHWSVFDPGGRWLGTVETPAWFMVREIGEDHVAGVFLDDEDVEHVRVYALHKPDAG